MVFFFFFLAYVFIFKVVLNNAKIKFHNTSYMLNLALISPTYDMKVQDTCTHTYL